MAVGDMTIYTRLNDSMLHACTRRSSLFYLVACTVLLLVCLCMLPCCCLFVGELDPLLGLHDQVRHEGVQTCTEREGDSERGRERDRESVSQPDTGSESVSESVT